jgi:signal transduction histidine kinase/FixJ family two-component response regulator
MGKQQDTSLVLVVDDHQPAAEMVAHIFRSKGFEVAIANEGVEALEKAQQLIPDIILLDVMMPGLNGFEVLAGLRERQTTANIPVIFVTAKDAAADIEFGLELGADDYIVKPVKPREVLARAKSKIEERRLRDTLRQRTTELEALLRFSEELNNYLDIDSLLGLILYLVLDLIPCKIASIYHLDEQGRVLDVRVEQKQIEENWVIDTESLLQEIVQFRQSTLIWGNYAIQSCELLAGMAVNLQHIEQLHGILVVLSDRPFTDRDKILLEAIGRQTTLALRNADLYAVKVNYAEHLEEMVEERTEELRSAQELLSRAEKLASVGRLAAGLAHEINNPLMPIRMNLEGMQEDLQQGIPIDERDLEQSLHSVNRISRIVERLQQFTRHGGEDAPQMEPLAVDSVMESVLALSETYMRHNKVNLNVHIENDTYVYGNRDQLEQVFLNIILNAQAAMDEGGTLAISASNKGRFVQIRFADTGHGIPPEMLDKIFEPFVSTKEDGSGLGLFISHNVIHSHSGEIGVESVVGKGTIFTLTLPTLVDGEMLV